jgi:hypothetical protein
MPKVVHPFKYYRPIFSFEFFELYNIAFGPNQSWISLELYKEFFSAGPMGQPPCAPALSAPRRFIAACARPAPSSSPPQPRSIRVEHPILPPPFRPQRELHRPPMFPIRVGHRWAPLLFIFIRISWPPLVLTVFHCRQCRSLLPPLVGASPTAEFHRRRQPRVVSPTPPPPQNGATHRPLLLAVTPTRCPTADSAGVAKPSVTPRGKFGPSRHARPG